MKIAEIVRTVLILLCVAVFLFSAVKLYGIYAEYSHGTESYEELTDQYVSEAADAEETEPESTEIPELTEPEETTPITVDFDALLKENGDVVGWLYCEDTPINYPIVQSKDNDYYLRRLLDGTWNIAGTIFMDYRNASDFSDWNTIIYGHNMNNDSMFGTLQDYKKQAYYEEHPVLYLLTPEQDYKIQLFSGYTTSATEEKTYGFPDTIEGRDVLVENALQHSTFEAEEQIGDEVRIITLSTCAYEYDDARYVLVGVLQPLNTAAEESRKP